MFFNDYPGSTDGQLLSSVISAALWVMVGADKSKVRGAGYILGVGNWKVILSVFPG